MNNAEAPERVSEEPSPSPFRSMHTASFPEMLAHFGVSILVTTYQAGLLVVLRNDRGVLNTHFRRFAKPMGLAHWGGRLAVGCQRDIAEFHNMPAICQKLDEREDRPVDAPKHDACFMPRRVDITGNIQIHEMAWCGSELIFVNTEFSCLARRDDVCSFEPVWRPAFVDQLGPGDRCHLNGLASRDGEVRYVTALGTTNTPGGWREHKRHGGVVIEVPTQKLVAGQLCMPHSPRWHQGELWVLESGTGTLGKIDLDSGRYIPVAELPGFTRGLYLVGNVAFVGLSKVRESATFGEIPLLDRISDPDQRSCGVWAIDLYTGATLGYCEFEGSVQEIFALEVLTDTRWPDVINNDEAIISRSFVLRQADQVPRRSG